MASPRLALLIGLLLATVATARGESATGLPRSLLSGGGGRAGDCAAGLEVVGIAARPGTTTVVCEDGDPICDRDHLANGRCELWARLCFDRPDAACTAGAATAVVVDGADAERDAAILARTLPAVTLPADAPNTCAPLTTVTVPLGRRRNGSARKGRKTIAWEATASGGTDRDAIKFLCKPPRKERRRDAVSFATLQRRVFQKQCAFSGCHGTDSPQAGLVLVGDAAYDALVDQLATTDSAQFAGKKRVVPGAPETSFLMDKLEGKLAPGEGAPMPLARKPLAANEMAAIRQWIRAGAPRERVVGGNIAGARDAQPRIPAPAVPAGGYQAHMTPFPLGDVPETEGCQTVRLDNEDDVFVRSWELFMHEGSHHFILRAFRCTDDDGDGTNDCDEPDFDARFPTGFRSCDDFGPNWAFLVGSQTPHFLVDYQTQATGVAVPLHRRQPLLLNSHYTNPFADTQAEVWVNVTPVDAALVRHPARILFETLANAFIDVAPGTERTAAADTCAFAASGLCQLAGEPAPAASHFALLGVTSHMHKRSLKFVTDLFDPAGTPVSRGADDMTDPADGSRHLYVSTDYSDPVNLAFWPPIVVQAGQRLAYTCHLDNGVDTPVKLGCEETPGVVPGRSILEQVTGGQPTFGGAARWCRADSDCTGFGTGRCVPANLVFGNLSDDDMCILPGLYYPCSGGPETCTD